MNQLLYHLIYRRKNKRWLTILDEFEENQTMTAKELAIKIGRTSRTIQTDIKRIKDWFKPSIFLLGDEVGYHFFFQNPVAYIKKKQSLLSNEPLFLFADQLLAGTRRTNQEWAEKLLLSPASFGRVKRIFVTLLSKYYHLTLAKKDNQLQGKEPTIRQFMYDLYFTLPLYPKVLDKRIKLWNS